MRRLISVLIAILIGSSLPLYAQECCDQETSHCHHNAPTSKPPCEPSVSVCPDSACLIQRLAVTPSVQANRVGHPALVLCASRFAASGPTLFCNTKNFGIRPPMNPRGALFLRNHSFLI
jgi:hypothetical protein